MSHHPPVTAYSIWNAAHGVHLQGYNGQKASVSRSLTIVVKQVGHAILRLAGHDEEYLITLPSLHIEGLYSGSPFVELDHRSFIQSSSGFTARIDYAGRGWLSGRKNSFTAVLHKTGDASAAPLYSVEGQWTSAFAVHEGPKGGREVARWDPDAHASTELQVADVSDQDEIESRRAWLQVAQAITRGDMDAVAHYKGLIENEQRDLRRREREGGEEWPRRYFARAEDVAYLERLAEHVSEALEPDKTDGVWRWEEEKAKAAKAPFSTKE